MIRADDSQEHAKRTAEATVRTKAEFGLEPQRASVRGFMFGICAVAGALLYGAVQTQVQEDGLGLAKLFIAAFTIGFASAVPARLRWRRVWRRHAARVQAEAETLPK